MSAKNQHDIHPDAETLSTFAEQALGEHERGKVLAHLAVCGRCRQIVSLASEAASAEAETPAGARHAVVRPRVWWRGWGLALAPVVALAAIAVVAVYFHERDVERSAEEAKLERQQLDEKTPMSPQALPQPQAEVAPPSPVAPVSAPPKARETERPAAEKRAAVAEPDEKAAAPAPGATGEPDSARDEPASRTDELHKSIAAVPALPSAASAPPRPSASQETPPDIAMYGEERRMRAEEKATDRRQFAAKAATPASESRTGSGAPGSNEQVVVTDQQLEAQPDAPASVGSLMKFRSGGFSGGRAANRVHLPSGLPPISIAHKGPRMLAIDNAGALFLSEDSGANWEPVTTQWAGRAMLVRKSAEPGSAAVAPLADKSKVAGDSPDSRVPPESNTVFELLNDQGQLWWSTDGRIWSTK
jgi:hypothetical protein